MGQEVDQNVILQAIVELSNQLKDTKTELPKENRGYTCTINRENR